MHKKNKALLLFSGGLDSILAVKVLQIQNIDVIGLAFNTCFFNSDKAREVAKQIDIELIEQEINNIYLKVVKNPRHGYGKNMNPCIDCRLLMFSEAIKVMEERQIDILATGEVLGQRPMSQNKQAFQLIEKKSGLDKKILRPLSAKLLPQTEAEENGIVDRDKLYDIQGRSRFRQFKLAENFKIKYFPTPGGGCILTDPEFSKRLKKLMTVNKDFSTNDVELIKNGRIFWPKYKEQEFCLLIGRDEKENNSLEKLTQKDDILIDFKDEVGPIALFRSWPTNNKKIKTQLIRVDVPIEIDKTKIEQKEYKDFKNLIDDILQSVSFYSPRLRGKSIYMKIKNL